MSKLCTYQQLERERDIERKRERERERENERAVVSIRKSIGMN